MSDLQIEQSNIDKEIVEAVIDCTPEQYFDFELLLTSVQKDGQDVGNVKHVLTCLDGNGVTVTPSDDVFNAVRRLSHLFSQHGIKWERITYHIYCDENDMWRFEADFVYGDESPKKGDMIQ